MSSQFNLLTCRLNCAHLLALAGLVAACFLTTGCAPPDGTADKPEKPPRENIIGRTTTDIGEYDPDAENQVTNPETEVSGMFTYALEAYGPTIGKISKLHIQQAVNLFWGAEGRYPKDYEEFVEKILKPNNIELPVLPGDAQYKYDVENHELVIVAPKKKE